MKLIKNAKFLNGLAGVTAIAAVGTVTLGGAWAFFTATESSAGNSFTAGTVTVGNQGTASTTCTVTGIVPGDSSASYGSLSQALSACAYRVKYTGSASAYLAVDISVTAGSTALYDATANGLQVKVLADSTSFMDGTTYKVENGTNTSLAAGTPVTNLLVSATPATTNSEVTFDIRYGLPTSAGNGYQGGSATVTLTFHAVQSANQGTITCVAGRQCGQITWAA